MNRPRFSGMGRVVVVSPPHCECGVRAGSGSLIVVGCGPPGVRPALCDDTRCGLCEAHRHDGGVRGVATTA